MKLHKPLLWAALLLAGISASRAESLPFNRARSPLVPQAAQAITFTDLSTVSPNGSTLPGANRGACAWGDIDNDGDLDAVVTGETTAGGAYFSTIYVNTAGVFAAGQSLVGVNLSAVAFGDYDADGDLDLALSGKTAATGTTACTTLVYNNVITAGSASFTAITNSTFQVMNTGSMAWGDYDSDGDLDLLIAGATTLQGSAPTSANIQTSFMKLYKNTNGAFTDAGLGLTGFYISSVAWGDADNDGDLDFAAQGSTYNGTTNVHTTNVFINNGGSFTKNTLTGGGSSGQLAWNDYDNDGDLDLFAMGSTNGGTTGTANFFNIYQNNGSGTFTTIAAATNGLFGIYNGSISLGDYDNDGDVDVLESGTDGTAVYARIYNNNGSGTYALNGTNSLTGFGGSVGCVQWGDYDADGDLDILILGNIATGGTATNARTKILRNTGVSTVNAAPSAPGSPVATTTGSTVTFTWAKSTDAVTPQGGLSYNIRIGTTSGSSNVYSSMSNTANGYRKLAARGPQQFTASGAVFSGLKAGTYFWSVQAIDAAYAGSAFSTEGTFTTTALTDIGAGLPALAKGAAAWGDYDNDGDLDVVLTGETTTAGTFSSAIYKNTAGVFSLDATNTLIGVSSSSAAWGDYDSDGDLDLVLTGLTSASACTTLLYNNNGSGRLTSVSGSGLVNIYNGMAAWADIDNDGDLDMAMSGLQLAPASSFSTSGTMQIFRNNGSNNFTDVSGLFPALGYSAVAFGDYDNDGDQDLVASGYNGTTFAYTTTLFNNNGGAYTASAVSLLGANNAANAFSDYDGDGYLDLVIAGTINGNAATTANVSTALYHNNGNGTFSSVASAGGLPNLCRPSFSFGDIDNDGDQDLALSGFDGANSIARIYTFTGTAYVPFFSMSGGGQYGSVSFGDYNGDNLLDVLSLGDTVATYSAAAGATRIYRISGGFVNTPPTAPTGLNASVNGLGRVTLSWTKATDTKTPQNGLSYNIRVGTSSGASNIFSPQASSTGFRRVPARGALQYPTIGDTIKGLAAGTYYWSVQAIDGALGGSAFGTEGSFTVASLSDASAGLPSLWGSSVSWADYDNDGDLDAVLSGETTTAGAYQTSVYKNNGNGTFSNSGFSFTGMAYGSATWGDYDNDGYSDLLVTGQTSTTACATKLYHNNAGASFSAVSTNLTGVYNSAAAFGDYDKDGDLDIALSGLQSFNGTPANSGTLRIFKNTAGTFTDLGLALPGYGYSALAWGDADNDGDLDLAVSGYYVTSAAFYSTQIYSNTGGSFAPSANTFTGVNRGSLAFGDYDADGDLDLLLSGNTSATTGSSVTQIYRNAGGVFTNINASVAPFAYSSAAWGDYDNDGDLDFAISGLNGTTNRTARVYSNNAGSFSDIGFASGGGSFASLAWADYDNDGDLDLLLSGTTSGNGTGASVKIFKSVGQTTVNNLPASPSNLNVTVSGQTALLSFTKATDLQTPAAGLGYSYQFGTVSNPSSVVPGQASPTNGYRRVAVFGSPGRNAVDSIKNVPPGTYNIAVQAIDGALTGSFFSTPQTVSFGNNPPTANSVPDTTVCSFGGLQTVSVHGITDGNSYTQTLTITAVSNNTSVLPNPTVVYNAGSDSLVLQFVPVSGRSGVAQVTLTLNDGFASNNLKTQTFRVNVTATGHTWLGRNSNWNDHSNWNCFPTAGGDITLPAGKPHLPVIGNGVSISARNLTVGDTITLTGTGSLSVSGTLTNSGSVTVANNNFSVPGNVVNTGVLSVGSHSFSVGGNWNNTGTFSSATATVTFNGTSAQTISGSTTFWNLAIANASSGRVTNNAGSAVRVLNTLSLPSGGLYTNNGSTTLASTTTGTARLGVLTAAGQYAGTLTTERWVPGSLTALVGSNIMVGSPFTNTVLGDFQTPLNQMFGFPGATGTGGSSANASSVWLYDPTNNDATNLGWVKPSSINMAMPPGKGARIFMSGRFMAETNYYSLTGTLPSSITYNIPLQYCASGCAPGYTTNGFNLVGNPVPSEISWRSAGWTKTNIGAAIYIWQQKNKRFSVYNYDPAIGSSSRDSTNGGTGIIPSGQGFFVQATGANPVLTATEAVKQTGGANPYSGLQRLASDYRFVITGVSPAGYSNQAVIGFRNDATRGFDAALDAVFLSGGGVDVAAMPQPDVYQAVSKMPLPASTDSLPLYFNSPETGVHTLTFSNLAELSGSGFGLYLKDNYNGSVTDLSANPEYSFTVSAAAASKGNTRFVLLFVPNTATGTVKAVAGLSFEVVPNPGCSSDLVLYLAGCSGNTAALSVTDVMGRQVYAETLSLTSGAASVKPSTELAAGVYLFTCKVPAATITRRVVIN